MRGLRPVGGASGVHKPLFPSQVERLRRVFVDISDADVSALRRVPKRDAATEKRARCGYCGGKPATHTEIIVDDMWQEEPIDGEWMTAARLVYQGDDLVIGELRIFPRDRVWAPFRHSEEEPGVWSAELLGQRATVPGGGLRARMVHRIKLRHAERRTGLLKMYAREHPELFESSGRFHALGIRKPKQALPKARERSELFFAMLAAEYVQAVDGDPRRPVAAVADRRGLEPSRVRDLLHTARVRGFLSPGVQGRSGGALTERAIQLLKSAPGAPKLKKRQRSKHGKGR